MITCKRCDSPNMRKVYGMKDSAFGEFWYSIREDYQTHIAQDFKLAYPATAAKKHSFRDLGHVANSCEECGFSVNKKYL